MSCRWDGDNKQILSSLCMHCGDPDFTPVFDDMENVGCCRYEPVFTLFEIYKMVRDGDDDFFMNHIYHHPKRRIFPYEILVEAQVDDRFYRSEEQEKYRKWLANASTRYRAVDFKMTYSICSFFVSGKGCGLPPRYKTSICRSFVCHTIEDQAAEETRQQLKTWQRSIIEEAESFNRVHQEQLQARGWNLIDHPDQVLTYLKMLPSGGRQA
ncbi:MAG: hypothetical protein H0Z33_14080 [Bacillaceae bacterium]|nr:hypothetical protein [Bacillaceae bacterium]